MNFANDLKAKIDTLSPDELAMLSEWFGAHERWKLGTSNECFVIMPFSASAHGRDEQYWTKFFDNFLKPALAKCGYVAKRSVAAQDNIVENIVQDLAWADLVVAVLTSGPMFVANLESAIVYVWARCSSARNRTSPKIKFHLISSTTASLITILSTWIIRKPLSTHL